MTDAPQRLPTEVLHLVIQHLNIYLVPDSAYTSLKYVCKDLRKAASKTLYQNLLFSIIVQSPPCEINDIIFSLQGAISQQGQPVLTQAINLAIPEYHKKYMTHVSSPSHSHQVLITKYGEVEDGVYLDPMGKQKIRVNHTNCTSFSSYPYEPVPEVEAYRVAFEQEAVQYVQDRFPFGATTVYASQTNVKITITICISATRCNPNNFWGGNWRSVWQVTIPILENSNSSNSESKTAEISGQINIRIHYYEDGNIQMNNTYQKRGQCDVSDPVTTAEKAAEQIRNFEQIYYNNLEKDVFFSESTFFRIGAYRRPYYGRRRWDWSKIARYKLGSIPLEPEPPTWPFM